MPEAGAQPPPDHTKWWCKEEEEEEEGVKSYPPPPPPPALVTVCGLFFVRSELDDQEAGQRDNNMAAAAEVNRFVTVKHYIDGVPSESDFEIKCGAPLTALLQRADQGSGLVIVKNLYVSVDPYQLNRAKMLRFHQSGLDFMERLVPGEAIGNALGVGVVVASGDPEFGRDDAVVGFLGWEEYTAVRPAGRATMLKKIQTREFPLSYHLSVLGTHA